MTFYDRYVELCSQKGVSPSRAATDCGINRSNVSSWKKQGYTPKAAVFPKLAHYFDITVDELLDGVEGNISQTTSPDDNEYSSELQAQNNCFQSSTKQILAANLKRHLDLKQVSQQELASFLQIAPSTVSSWCAGEKMPRIEKLEEAASYLDVSLVDLLSNDESSAHLSPNAYSSEHNECNSITLSSRSGFTVHGTLSDEQFASILAVLNCPGIAKE